MSESSSGSLCFLRFLGVSVFYFFSRQMHRRDTEGTEKAQRAFTLALIIICLSPLITYSQSTPVRPRMLIGQRDPLTGFSVLRERYAAGARPGEAIDGLALTYLLTNDESFARRAVDEPWHSSRQP